MLLTFVCNDRMSDTVDEMDSTSRAILDEAISFINRTVGVSCNLITTCRGMVTQWLRPRTADLNRGRPCSVPVKNIRELFYCALLLKPDIVLFVQIRRSLI